MGSLGAVYNPLLDSVPSTPAGEVQIGSITVASPCTLDPSFTVIRYNSGLFHLSKRTDTTWAVWLIRTSGSTGLAVDTARIYMTLSGIGCPTVDVAQVSYGVFRKPPSSVRANTRDRSTVWVSQLEDGRLLVHTQTRVRVAIHTVTGAVLKTVDSGVGTTELSISDLATGMYYYTVRGAEGIVSGKVIIP
jgi:hypothetical protein